MSGLSDEQLGSATGAPPPKPAAAKGKEKGKEAPAEKAAADKAKAAETLAALEASQGLRSVLPEGCWDLLSPQLYGTFWRLSLYDILVPRER